MRRRLDAELKAVFKSITHQNSRPDPQRGLRADAAHQTSTACELPVPKSTGENQILSLSFVAAVSKLAREIRKERRAEGERPRTLAPSRSSWTLRSAHSIRTTRRPWPVRWPRWRRSSSCWSARARASASVVTELLPLRQPPRGHRDPHHRRGQRGRRHRTARACPTRTSARRHRPLRTKGDQVTTRLSEVRARRPAARGADAGAADRG